jgi:hypothetical protein
MLPKQPRACQNNQFKIGNPALNVVPSLRSGSH